MFRNSLLNTGGQYKFYVPENLNIDEILSKYPPEFPVKRKFNRDHLIQIIDLLCTLPAQKKDILTKDEFIPICAARLNTYVFAYQYYLQYLEKIGVIICDNKYVTESWSTDANPVKCLGYKFVEEYNKSYKKIELTNTTATALRNKLGLPSDYRQRRYKYISKWLNPHLKINAEAAREYAADWYEYIKDKKYLWKPKEKKLANGRKVAVGLKDPINALKYYNIAIDLFESQEFYWDVDDVTRRFHSSITNLKKEFRNFVTYDGHELVGIDLKNSQPYLSLVLFEPTFWLNEHQKINIKDLKQQKIAKEVNKIMGIYFGEESSNYSKHMIDKLASLQENSSFQRYKNKVSEGQLYDHVLEACIDFYLDSDNLEEYLFNLDRHAIKLELIKVLYAGNRYNSIIKKVITGQFEEPFNFFKLIKTKNKKRLSYLLQSLESTLFIQRIIKRITNENPKLPVYAIHDNIVTVRGHEGFVEHIMTDELFQATGVTPKFGREYWNSDNPKLRDFLPAWKA